MKNLIYLLALLPTMAVAQTSPADSSRSSDAMMNSRSSTDQSTSDLRRTVNKAEDKVREEVRESISYQQRNKLSWFQPESIFVGGSLGLGTGGGSTYLNFSPRVGYFFQPGFMGGLRFDFDRRINRSYSSRQTGLMVRYYPFQTRISGFVGGSYNFGREFSNSIPSETKARYNSISLEIGTMFLITKNIGAELALENNYYDRIDESAGRTKGARFKFGVNYYFGRANR